MVIEGPPRPATWLPRTGWNLLESCGTLWNAVGAPCGPRQPRPPLTESLWLPAGTWTQVPQRVCAGRRGCLEARTSSCREREDQGAVKHSRCPKPVDKVCGQPKQQEGNLSSDHIVPVKEATETQALVMAHASLNNKRSSLPLKASKNDKSRSLKKISREFINYMKRSRTFYASIAERLCEGDLVMKDSSTCWNGEDVVESFWTPEVPGMH